VAALFAASREDLTSVLGRHALEKTVDAFAATVMRLKSPLHLILLGVERKARYCIGFGERKSRKPGFLRIVLGLSTPVDSAVDNRLVRRRPNPCSTRVPAGFSAGLQTAEKAKTPRFLGEIGGAMPCG
jgi:hypothetical protein